MKVESLPEHRFLLLELWVSTLQVEVWDRGWEWALGHQLQIPPGISEAAWDAPGSASRREIMAEIHRRCQNVWTAPYRKLHLGPELLMLNSFL